MFPNLGQILLLCLVGQILADEDILIQIPDGKLKGKSLLSYSGRLFNAFLGIPYAKPPVKELRFADPEPPLAWNGIKDATNDPQRCAHLSYPERKFIGSENCLFVNVFTSQIPTSNFSDLQDVVVFIHNGGFTFGSGDTIHHGPEHMLDEDIVLVTFNYRLGPLGFLSTGDKVAPGNYGLKDQVAALKWVSKNIKYFGGNADRVTILGTQSGGVSVHLHLLSSQSSGLFHRAISQSGTALSPWAVISANEAFNRAQKLGVLLGCNENEVNDSKKLIECINSKELSSIYSSSHRFTEWSTDLSYPFVPVIENENSENPFLSNHPKEIMSKPSNISVPWMIGMVQNEGLPQALQLMLFSHLLKNLNENFPNTITHYLGMNLDNEELENYIGLRIWDFYIRNQTINLNNLPTLEQVITDYHYFVGMCKCVELMSESWNIPIYVYHLSYNKRDTPFALGIPQGDDKELLFPITIGTDKLLLREKDIPYMKKLRKLVLDFARTGDPSPEKSELLDNIEWPIAETHDFKYLDFGKELQIKSEFYKKRMKFWESIEKVIHDVKYQNVLKKDEL